MLRLLIGNWKMHLTVSDAQAYVRTLLPLLKVAGDREIALAPPFVALSAIARLLEGSPVRLAAQNLFWEDEGPYTGEISGPMLQEAGVTYVLVAHSERRRHLEESDRAASRKIAAALRCGLSPVLCVGEDEMERTSGKAATVVQTQLARGLEGVAPGAAPRLQIAYEPVWAIGTGKSATPAQAAEMHDLIRRELAGLFGEAGSGVRILYGGSVTSSNVDELMRTPGVDGALVGGASLKADEFARITAYR
ncbi:MAG TPA: triose-phosphate isomerase [Candidatus Polarisedimenticolia bacterium]|jgi:triosephosphate isomerase|nr:triose-phosphate isomerase [Candidatus Polarisedimenticolia bacterium]